MPFRASKNHILCKTELAFTDTHAHGNFLLAKGVGDGHNAEASEDDAQIERNSSRCQKHAYGHAIARHKSETCWLVFRQHLSDEHCARVQLRARPYMYPAVAIFAELRLAAPEHGGSMHIATTEAAICRIHPRVAREPLFVTARYADDRIRSSTALHIDAHIANHRLPEEPRLIDAEFVHDRHHLRRIVNLSGDSGTDSNDTADAACPLPSSKECTQPRPPCHLVAAHPRHNG